MAAGCEGFFRADYFSPAQRAARAACVPRIEVQALEGGHHLHMERAAEVGARLRAFLAG
jgi:pimeloyl-ACP methyl ester carboxylesterase